MLLSENAEFGVRNAELYVSPLGTNYKNHNPTLKKGIAFKGNALTEALRIIIEENPFEKGFSLKLLS